MCVVGFLWLKFGQGKPQKEKPQSATSEETKQSTKDKAKNNKQEKQEPPAKTIDKKVKKEEKHKQCIFEVKGHKDGMNCFMFSSTGKLAASTGDDRRVIIWDATKVPLAGIC